jgi:hypothetical protein
VEDSDGERDQRSSSFRLEISIAVGYRRRRALTGKWESGVTTVALLAAGIVVVILVVWQFFKLF